MQQPSKNKTSAFSILAWIIGGSVLAIIWAGIAFAVIGIYNGISSIEEGYNGTYEYFDETTELVVTNYEEKFQNDKLIILGTLQNNSENIWSGVSVEVEVFDKNGKFLDECDAYLDGRIKPTETENFKVTCGGCAKESLPSYDHITIEVTDAYYESE